MSTLLSGCWNLSKKVAAVSVLRRTFPHAGWTRGLSSFSLRSRLDSSPWKHKSLSKSYDLSETAINRLRDGLSPSKNASSATTNKLEELEQFKQWNNAGCPSNVVAVFEATYGRRDPATLEGINPSVLVEYFKALAQTRQLDRVYGGDLRYTDPMPQMGVHGSTKGPEFVLSLAKSSKPVEVSVLGLSKQYSFLREITKYAVTALLWVAGISIIAEGAIKNIPKGLGLNGGKKIQAVTNTNTTFNDVKGCDEVKEELQEIVSYLTDPKKFTRLGAKLPKGILLSGPPGTGKTLLARAIAGEAKVPFIQASGSDFEEMYVGVGARRIRDLFASARKMAPAIVFIDEIDAVGSKRNHRDSTSVRMTLNQLLVELDGFEQNSGVVVICATNFAQSLDSALTRPGRLDKTINVPLPDVKGRQEILELYGAKVLLDKDVDLSIMARLTGGMTGADLFNVLNIAAVKSSAEGKAAVTMNELELAFDRVVVGLERRNPMSQDERKVTAFHEAGHALVAWFMEGASSVHKATIMPRGDALGVTWTIPPMDRYQMKLTELQASLGVLMGGKAAELLIYGPQNVTAGCGSDLQRATSIAREMVTKWGMGDTDSQVPLYIDYPNYGALSEDLRKKVDGTVQRLLDKAFQDATDILTKHLDELTAVAEALVEFETITNDEIKLVLDGRKDEISKLRLAQNSKEQQDKKASGKLEELRRRLRSLPSSDKVEDKT